MSVGGGDGERPRYDVGRACERERPYLNEMDAGDAADGTAGLVAVSEGDPQGCLVDDADRLRRAARPLPRAAMGRVSTGVLSGPAGCGDL